MKKTVKYYRTFTDIRYRLLLIVVVPAAILGLRAGAGIWLGSRYAANAVLAAGGMTEEMLDFLCCLLLMLFDLLLDYWAFGGIAVKGTDHLGCLKTSARGIPAMAATMRADQVRRLAESVAVPLLGRVVSGTFPGAQGIRKAEEIGYLLAVSVSLYFVSTLAVSVARYWEKLEAGMSLAGLLIIVLGVSWAAGQFWPWAVLAAAASLSAGASVFFYRKMIRRWEESFYDK